MPSCLIQIYFGITRNIHSNQQLFKNYFWLCLIFPESLLNEMRTWPPEVWLRIRFSIDRGRVQPGVSGKVQSRRESSRLNMTQAELDHVCVLRGGESGGKEREKRGEGQERGPGGQRKPKGSREGKKRAVSRNGEVIQVRSWKEGGEVHGLERLRVEGGMTRTERNQMPALDSNKYLLRAQNSARALVC